GHPTFRVYSSRGCACSSPTAAACWPNSRQRSAMPMRTSTPYRWSAPTGTTWRCSSACRCATGATWRTSCARCTGYRTCGAFSGREPESRLRSRRLPRLRAATSGRLLRQQLLQLARLVHLAHDVAAADEFAVDVKLRDRRPVGELLDAIADFRVLQHVDRK